MAVYTKLSTDRIKDILRGYSLNNIDRISEIPEGILNTNYLVEGGGEKFIFRILEGKRDYREEVKELDFLHYMNSKGFPCPVALNNTQGKNYTVVEGKMASVFTFIEGEKVDTIDRRSIREIGRNLGIMHNLLRNNDIKRNRMIDMDYFYNIISRADLKGILGRRYDTIMKLYKRAASVDYSVLPQGIIHNDIFPDNVFMKNGVISGLIDFNDCLKGPLILDLAIVINFWIRNKNLSSKEEAVLTEELLQAYEEERPLSQEEKEFMNEAILKVALTFIFLRINKFHVEDTSGVNMEVKDHSDLFPLLEYYLGGNNEIYQF